LHSYDYTQENYTELLWFFEGFTSYYDDLLLRRAGRIDNTTYLKLLSKTINQVQQTPGRRVQTVAQASRDAWVKYYRQDENTANATVSYYTKGALVALCLDLSLRAEGKTTLDAVMRGLWARCARRPNGPGRPARRFARAGGALVCQGDCPLGTQHGRVAAGRAAGAARRAVQSRTRPTRTATGHSGQRIRRDWC